MPEQGTAEPVVETASGWVRGRTGPNGIHAFLGVPYGAPTGGARRFLPARAPEPWPGIRGATDYGPAAPQEPQNGPAVQRQYTGTFPFPDAPQSEDCLFLNVWTPGLAAEALRPVMVWWHGGSFRQGSANAPRTDGTALARRQDVVVVSVTHRVNAFGHLYLEPWLGEDYATSGNIGMLDLIASLAWIRDHIASFGGDPENVTLFGVSGGGAKISTAMAMPRARGLFHRGIIQSGHDLWKGTSRDAAERATRAVLGKLGLDPGGPDLHAALLGLPMETLRDATAAATREAAQDPGCGRAGWELYDLLAPVVDGVDLVDQPIAALAAGASADVHLAIGTRRHDHVHLGGSADFGWLDGTQVEAALRPYLGDETERILAVYRRTRPGASASTLLATILADGDWRLSAIRLAEAKLAGGGNAPFMYFSELDSGGDPTPFVFDNLQIPTVTAATTRAVASQVGGAWAAFARSGDPSHPGIPAWPAHDLERRATMILDYDMRVEDDPRSEERLAWDGIR